MKDSNGGAVAVRDMCRHVQSTWCSPQQDVRLCATAGSGLIVSRKGFTIIIKNITINNNKYNSMGEKEHIIFA